MFYLLVVKERSYSNWVKFLSHDHSYKRSVDFWMFLWSHHQDFCPSQHREEILTIFSSCFGRKRNFINSFRNLLTFKGMPNNLLKGYPLLKLNFTHIFFSMSWWIFLCWRRYTQSNKRCLVGRALQISHL